MSVAARVEAHLQKTGVQYDLVEHPYSRSSMQTAHLANVQPDHLAKAVIIHDGDNFRMCVIPAAHRLVLDWMNSRSGSHYRLATEDELCQLFDDCVTGAVPALGQVYGMPVTWDNQLEDLTDIYLESGDHRHLIHLHHSAFLELMGLQQHELISCADEEFSSAMTH